MGEDVEGPHGFPFADEVVLEEEALGGVDFYDDVGDGVVEVVCAVAPFFEDSCVFLGGGVVAEEVFGGEFGALNIYNVIQIVFWLIEHPDESPELGGGRVDCDDGNDWRLKIGGYVFGLAFLVDASVVEDAVLS